MTKIAAVIRHSLNTFLALFTVVLCVAAVAGDAPRNPDDPALIRGSGTVNWRAWSPELLKESERTSKPILLFITSNWCHWGKVMERITFTDLEVATRLNEQFIPVRLNRDAHPHLDLRMQMAMQALSGNRGLPLNAFLTPDGRPFFGGTFFPAEEDAAAARPGLREIINQSRHLWRTQREGVQRQAASVEDAVKKALNAENPRGEISAELCTDVVEQIRASLDLGAAPDSGAGRFAAPRALDLALAHYGRTGDTRSLQSVIRTLDAMLRGGIFDRLEGGFHRCSSDAAWRVPRFEKLLVQNAEMIPVLVHAWQITGVERYKDAALRTLGYWSGMMDPGSTWFYGSQAGGASDIDDGDYYTWTVKEVERALRDDTDCRLALAFFDIGECGDLPATAPARNVLFEAQPLSEASKRAALSEPQARARLERIHHLLTLARRERRQPAIDKNIYADGNALMASAFIEAGRALGEPAFVKQGLKTISALLSQPDQHVIVRKGLETVPAMAQDDAALMYACSLAFEASGDPSFTAGADACLKRLEKYWDAKDGGYADALSDELPLLKTRIKIYQDTTEPATNGLIALACARMAALSDNKNCSERAKAIVSAFGKALAELGPYGATLTSAAELLHNGTTLITVSGSDNPEFAKLLSTANSLYAPAKLVVTRQTLPAERQGKPQAHVTGAGKTTAVLDAAALKAMFTITDRKD